MAKPRLTRAQVVKMKRSIIENVHKIIETTNKRSKDKMIKEECDKYDWYEDVVKYLGVEAILEYDCNIFDLKKAVYNKKFEEGVGKLDVLYKKYISDLREYLINEQKVIYGEVYSLGECSSILTEACSHLQIVPLTSSAYFRVLFDVTETTVKKPVYKSGYRVLREYTGQGVQPKGPIMKGN